MITRIPTKEYSLRPSIRDICLNYGLINSSTWSLGHLVKFYANILDKIGSTRVSLRTSATDTGKDSNCTRLICWISSFSWRTWSFNSNLDKQSAFACLFGDLYSISFWQPDNNSAHLCIQAAANVGISVLQPNKVTRGFWSVTNTNFRPYKYWWNLKTMVKASFSISIISLALVPRRSDRYVSSLHPHHNCSHQCLTWTAIHR